MRRTLGAKSRYSEKPGIERAHRGTHLTINVTEVDCQEDALSKYAEPGLGPQSPQASPTCVMSDLARAISGNRGGTATSRCGLAAPPAESRQRSRALNYSCELHMFVVCMVGPSTLRCMLKKLILKVARNTNVKNQPKLVDTVFGLGAQWFIIFHSYLLKKLGKHI